jgi:hypothetical protein
MRELEHAQ